MLTAIFQRKPGNSHFSFARLELHAPGFDPHYLYFVLYSHKEEKPLCHSITKLCLIRPKSYTEQAAECSQQTGAWTSSRARLVRSQTSILQRFRSDSLLPTSQRKGCTAQGGRKKTATERGVEAWAEEVMKHADNCDFQEGLLACLHQAIRPFSTNKAVCKLVQALVSTGVMAAIVKFPAGDIRDGLLADLLPASADPANVAQPLWRGLPSSAKAVYSLCLQSSFVPTRKQVKDLMQFIFDENVDDPAYDGLRALASLCQRSRDIQQYIYICIFEGKIFQRFKNYLIQNLYRKGVSEFVSCLAVFNPKVAKKLPGELGLSFCQILTDLFFAMFKPRDQRCSSSLTESSERIFRLCGLVESLFVDALGGMWRKSRLQSTRFCLVRGQEIHQVANSCIGVKWKESCREKEVEDATVEGLNLLEIIFRFCKGSVYQPQKNKATLAALKLLHAITVNHFYSLKCERRKTVEQFEHVLKTPQFPAVDDLRSPEWIRLWRECQMECIAALNTIQDIQQHARVIAIALAQGCQIHDALSPHVTLLLSTSLFFSPSLPPPLPPSASTSHSLRLYLSFPPPLPLIPSASTSRSLRLYLSFPPPLPLIPSASTSRSLRLYLSFPPHLPLVPSTSPSISPSLHLHLSLVGRIRQKFQWIWNILTSAQDFSMLCSSCFLYVIILYWKNLWLVFFSGYTAPILKSSDV